MISDYDKHVIGKYNREEGRMAERKVLAQSMLDNGIPKDLAAKVLGISEKELEVLLQG